MPAFKFSRVSETRLAMVHTELAEAMRLAIECSPVDFGISCGYRSESEQNRAYSLGYSKVKWPNSKHNRQPSDAVDFYPWVGGKIVWEDASLFYLIAGIILGIANAKGYEFRWGGAWDYKLNRSDQFSDLPHIERRCEIG